MVRNLSMQVKRGTIYGFLGPNGSGKTTTIRMLCGLLTPDEGTGTCLGYDIRTETDKIKRQVGYMTQRFSLYQDLSVRENLEFVARIYGLRDPSRAAREMVEHLGLSGREDQIAGRLSGGWKQRLALGACTLPSPQLLLLDEPTAGVDPKARREFWNEIHALAAHGLTVLVSTHYMDEAERCHEIAYIAYGELLVHGTVDEVVRQSNLTTYSVKGDDMPALAAVLEKTPSVDSVAPFGTSLHVSGRDQAALEAAIAISQRSKAPMDRDRAVARGRLHRADGAGEGQHAMTAAAETRGGGFWRRVGAMIRKEFVQLRRDRITFATIITLPLMQLVLFGYAINTQPRGLPTAVLLQENNDVGRSILKALENTRYFRITHQVRNEAEFDRVLASGEVLFAIEIPRGFERALRRGDRPALLIAADATDPVATTGALGALGNLLTTALRNDRAIPDAGSPPFEIRTHARYNPAGSSQLNIVPGLMGTILTLTMLIFTALSVTREIERGTMESLLSMPITPLEIMLGKIVPYVLIGFFQATLIVAAGVLLFDVPIFGDLALLALLSTLFIATNLSVGYTFRRWRRTSCRRSRWR